MNLRVTRWPISGLCFLRDDVRRSSMGYCSISLMYTHRICNVLLLTVESEIVGSVPAARLVRKILSRQRSFKMCIGLIESLSVKNNIFHRLAGCFFNWEYELTLCVIPFESGKRSTTEYELLSQRFFLESAAARFCLNPLFKEKRERYSDHQCRSTDKKFRC